ncbi:MAG: hypothetical protein V4792_15350 [Pseudomonadota bacterium]
MSAFSRWTLRIDGALLALSGSAAMLAETAGHFFGVGPLAAMRGSPYTIGGFEAHGLAVLIAVLLLRGAAQADRVPWHVVALVTHLFLGSANLLFWPTYAALGLVAAGSVTTALHIAFVAAQAACWRLERQPRSPS